MSNSITLPDVMPEITEPTLLVVCDSHHCKLFNVGGHTILMKEEVTSDEPHFTDRQSTKQSGGSSIGIGETEQIEENRLRTFANMLIARLEAIIKEQKISALYLSAPSKFLSLLKKDMPKSLSPLLTSIIDGNFVKESPRDILVRFRPDLEASVQALRSEENYSSKKHLPH
jgi:protein required for attachment to host cells